MPYTASQLTAFYTTLTGGRVPGATLTPLINTAAAQDAAGQITDAQAFGVVNYQSNDVRATGDVAVATYALFTGTTPSQAGINYLINNPGTGYNTSYYNGVGGTPTNLGPGGFDTENRYYNAAINLAATVGAVGYSSFNATYGGLTLAQTIATAYNSIIGTAAVGSSAASAAIASITSSLPYFQALASQRVVSGSSVDLATKAIIAAYILEEGIKADVGVYAQALDGFNAAEAMGTGVYNTNLLTTFGAGGTNFNAALQPLANGQTLTGGSTTTSLGVAANGVATINVPTNASLTFTGDTAINNGQAQVNVAGGGVLNLAYTGQTISTPVSVIAPGVQTLNLTANTNVAGAVLSIDFEDSSLSNLVIRGNESVAYSAPLYAFPDGSFSIGALTSINASGATAPVNIDLSSMTGTANSTQSGGVAVMGTSGADTFSVHNFANITGGGGNDTIMAYAPASIPAISAVTDDHAGVMVGFVGLKATAFQTTAINANSVQAGLNAAAAATGQGVVSYVYVGGDTYLFEHVGTATTYTAGVDDVIRLVGTHNLASSTLNAQGVLTLGG